MKIFTIGFAAAIALTGAFAHAQNGAPSGRGAATGDPAASSATPGTIANHGEFDEA